ncbi:hypothetical protein CO2235_200012 [Cupriavidus oxalaticus]|uniref:Uncharacterized protein n=1 Tax=Cupriavidus oxalaticus TaxID=96344 RepID=A0A976BCD4_9BURK|nr:hypothetical protein CO2235_200012 [Cupriavidus oxalaticus]
MAGDGGFKATRLSAGIGEAIASMPESARKDCQKMSI